MLLIGCSRVVPRLHGHSKHGRAYEVSKPSRRKLDKEFLLLAKWGSSGILGVTNKSAFSLLKRTDLLLFLLEFDKAADLYSCPVYVSAIRFTYGSYYVGCSIELRLGTKKFCAMFPKFSKTTQ